MKILLQGGLPRDRRAEIARAAAALLPGCRLAAAAGGFSAALPRPEKSADAAPAIENLPGVAAVTFTDTELCPRATAPGKKTFFAPLPFGRGPVFIAGPCAVEDGLSYLASAAALKAAGAHALRAAIFKPRSSPYAFQGIGWPGLKIIAAAKQLTGLPLVTETTDPRQVGRLAAVCDVLQIGARNMRNYELLKEAAGSGRAVLLKRAMRATLREWLLSAEYLLAHGARKVALCERGDADDRGPLLNLALLAAAQKISGLPVLADPSHAARSRERAAVLAVQALRAGADGLLLEASAEPLAARVDGRQTVDLKTFRAIAGTPCKKHR
jgi:3-deoxy-7-phosphoheptulonate synthase